ncbi:DUF443 family protein [Oceanobacillus sp. CFH 90083]|uniref:DUF443 family protein n=1 Tax=Oceanobacillus sp. CFH 90083 TaxID=2592336 RepID=UPI00128B8E5E|nr:DUF443 family protein [Oceanobacillus sp. CFH 90083]
MKASVQIMYRKIRYNLITLNGENYILDKDNPKWIILVPFLFWVIPHKAYKIDNQNTVDTLVHETTNKGGNAINVLAIGLSLVIANLIRPIMNSFNIEISTLIASFIVIFIALLMFLIRMSILKKNQQKLYSQVKSNLNNTKQFYIKTKSVKFLLIYIFCYMFILTFVINCALMYIEYGNSIILLIYTMLVFLFFMGNLFTVTPGKVDVKIKQTNL